MAQPFSFGFSGDDIDVDADVDQSSPAAAVPPAATPAQPEAALLPAQTHNVAALTKFPTQPRKSNPPLARSSASRAASSSIRRLRPDPLAGLDESDIRTNIYEGGFKTWECSVDLAKLLLDRGPRKDLDDLCRVDHVIEVSPPLPSYLPLLHTTNHPTPPKKLGCGTAIPALVLFHYALTQSLPLYFTLADYNASVLRLVTLPNLLLTWASTLPADSPLFTPETPNPFVSSESHGDLYLTPSLVAAFQATLAEAPLTLSLVSGSWVPVESFVDLVPSAPHMNTLVLASETIYSPAALSAFADACVGLLRRVRMGKAIVAAKRVYFGVGGGVDAFKEEAAARDAVVADVENSGVEMGQGGVRRCLLEVQMM
ncbi:hypothetical protein GTA08_BOTSDO14220 [Botryosphaeria dothidea]|uniref:protein-histidine N-methyltransferase n=1 Tax=Botryosphaeria dothidea TaxID=55169 RepID=A0A8H4IPC5_9PEZI|nr:hypothetical protein GTA08_BOTSDO14220 [Botryosphaeria dothidea]